MQCNNMKKMDTYEYVSVLRGLTDEGKEVSLRIAGNSMAPFLQHERDMIHFKKPDRKLKRGDMVFFQRKNGQYIMHRIWKVKPEGFYIVGDAQMWMEGPVEADQIFGLITRVQRKGRWIGPDNFWWWFFEKVWIRLVPVRGIICKVYGAFRGIVDSVKGKSNGK